MKEIPVVIIGSGPVGLSMALALARQDIPSIVFEKHHSLTQHPRARGVGMRTMELFQQWGNVDELLKYEQPKAARRFIWAHSLQGDEITRIAVEDAHLRTHARLLASFVTQDRVEASLYHALQKYPQAKVQFSKEVVEFTEDKEGVQLRVVDLTSNSEEIIRAQYLIAADGASSPVRKHLNIAMDGPEDLGRFCSVYCEIDLSSWTQDRPCISFLFTDPSISNCAFFAVDGVNRWIVMLRFSETNTANDFTNEFCIHEIRRVVQVADIPVNIINKNFWTMAAQNATRYRKGRIFLAGDAAHRLPPTGGFGMNTGIQDAHNLAWKLAYVLKYNAADSLLDSYFAERSTIVKQNIDWSCENAKRNVEIKQAITAGDKDKLISKLHEQHNNLNFEGLDIGFIYHSDLIMSENQQTINISASKFVPSTLPGSRAPHVSLIKDNKLISIFDLFEHKFVLLVGKQGQAWQHALNEIASSITFPLASYRVAPDGELLDPENSWHELYEISATGAVLVRPDGHVAWRSQAVTDDPKQTLLTVLKKILPQKNR